MIPLSRLAVYVSGFLVVGLTVGLAVWASVRGVQQIMVPHVAASCSHFLPDVWLCVPYRLLLSTRKGSTCSKLAKVDLSRNSEEINGAAAQAPWLQSPTQSLSGRDSRRAGHVRPVLCVELPHCVAIHMAKCRRASV